MSPSPAKRAWPSPRVRVLRADQAAGALGALARERPTALGVVARTGGVDGDGGRPSARRPTALAGGSTHGSARGVEIAIVSIDPRATLAAMHAGDAPIEVACLTMPTSTADPHEAWRALADLLVPPQDAPYVISPDGHRLAALLFDHGLTGVRHGCLRAASVLAAAAEGRPASASLEADVERWLDRELLSPLIGADEELARTASVLGALARRLVDRLRAEGSVEAFSTECRLIDAVVDMERAGMAFDVEGYRTLTRAWAHERQALVGSEGDEALARASRLDKLLSTYAHWADDFVDADGRIRCSLHPLAAESGRFSCSNPNLQQVPSALTAPGMRACFRAPPVRCLVIADYAQIELRVAAQLAPDPALRQVFIEGRDPHRATAATLTGKPETEITAHERKLAKAINFGFLFGMGARRFGDYAKTAYGLELDASQANAAREAFLTTYPGIAAWHRRIADATRGAAALRVRTALGRVKQFPPGSASFTTALNIPVQGTAAEGFKLAMIELHRRLPDVEGRGVLCVHDEYLAEVPEGRAEEAKALVAEIMAAQMQRVVPDVPIAVDVRAAAHWE